MAAELVIARSPRVLKLDLAAGQSPREGFEGVDLNAGDHRVDLLKFPWKWEDSSVDELHCSHFIEHIACREVEDRDVTHLASDHIGKDMLLAFFDECYRVLRPGGVMTVLCPNARSNRGFQDPTHRRFIVAETFAYLAKTWREANKLDHYRVACNFNSNVVPIIPIELSLLHADAQARRFNESWNTILDWSVTLTSLKPA